MGVNTTPEKSYRPVSNILRTMDNAQHSILAENGLMRLPRTSNIKRYNALLWCFFIGRCHADVSLNFRLSERSQRSYGILLEILSLKSAGNCGYMCICNAWVYNICPFLWCRGVCKFFRLYRNSQLPSKLLRNRSSY
jgi:hypothetical protein